MEIGKNQNLHTWLGISVGTRLRLRSFAGVSEQGLFLTGCQICRERFYLCLKEVVLKGILEVIAPEVKEICKLFNGEGS